MAKGDYNGVGCPDCGDVNVTGGLPDMGDGTVSQEVVCDECGKEWTNTYRFEAII